MWKTSLILLLVSFAVNGKTTKKRVCIVGAGVSGLVAARYLSEYPDEFEPIVFEKNSNVGGLWIYTDSTTVDEHGLPIHSSMYKNLRTNGIKAEMIFPDYPNFGGETSNFTFAKHEEVLQYLRNYTAHFNLRQYIYIDVEKIKPLPDLKWLTIWRNFDNNKISKTTCDIMIICNGHHFKGYIPKILGIETFTGRVLHSHVYRKPELFTNQTVVVLGASVSGRDIGIDISSQARKVYLSQRHDKIPGEFPSNMEQVPGVVEAKVGELVLSNGTKISADALVYCTGYVYDYPFLDESSGIVVEGGKHIHSIYKVMFNIERPSMAFVGLPSVALHFPLAHVQANYIREVLRGRLRLPSREQMLIEARMQLAKESPGKGPISSLDAFLKYLEEINFEAGGNPMPWWMHPYVVNLKKQYFRDPVHYKDKSFVIYENNRTVEFI